MYPTRCVRRERSALYLASLQLPSQYASSGEFWIAWQSWITSWPAVSCTLLQCIPSNLAVDRGANGHQAAKGAALATPPRTQDSSNGWMDPSIFSGFLPGALPLRARRELAQGFQAKRGQARGAAQPGRPPPYRRCGVSEDKVMECLLIPSTLDWSACISEATKECRVGPVRSDRCWPGARVGPAICSRLLLLAAAGHRAPGSATGGEGAASRGLARVSCTVNPAQLPASRAPCSETSAVTVVLLCPAPG